MSDHPGIAQRIESEWDHITAKLHKQSPESSAPSGSSQPKEQPMTTPQQRNLFLDVSNAMAEVAKNPLMVRLASERLGEVLNPDDIDHIIGIIRSLEQPHQMAAAIVQQPQFTPHDDSTPFPADGQHQQ